MSQIITESLLRK